MYRKLNLTQLILYSEYFLLYVMVRSFKMLGYGHWLPNVLLDQTVFMDNAQTMEI